jgi:hypothetical protein
VFLAGGRSLRILLSIVAVVVVTLLALIAPAARADSASCSLSSVSQPFLPWGDPAFYALVPGGDFENGTWSFAGGAQRVRGSEPYAATGRLGNWSLSLPTGSSAESPAACVSATEPSIRFFIAGRGTVHVDFVYGDTVIPSGEVVAAGDWTPSEVVLSGSALAAATGGTAVSIRFTSLCGAPVVDDVFIDPWNRG